MLLWFAGALPRTLPARSCRYLKPFADQLRKANAMEMIKALTLGAILSATIALVIGSQGISAGPLAIQLVPVAEVKLYWSWPIFFSGSGLAWGILLLQR